MKVVREGESVIIVDKLVTLRSIREDDLSLMREWRNKDHIRKWFFDSRIITPEMQQKWYESYQKRDDDQMFIISTSSVEIGIVALYCIDRVRRRVQFGRFLIGEDEYRSQGYACEAIRLLLKYAFEELGLEEVYLELLSCNEVALNLYEKVGFRAEKGKSRNIADAPGSLSITRMSLQRGDFR